MVLPNGSLLAASPKLRVRERPLLLAKRAFSVSDLKKIRSYGSSRGPSNVDLTGSNNFGRPSGGSVLLFRDAALAAPLQRPLASRRRNYDVGVLLLVILKKI